MDDAPTSPPTASRLLVAAQPPPTDLRSRLVAAWPLWVLLVLGGLWFLPVLRYPFTNWDDILFISENALLRQPGWRSLRQILTPGGVSQELLYLPLTYLSYLLESLVHKLHPGAVHGANLALHLGNTAMVWLVLRHWLRDQQRLAATLGAALFMLHPLQVEAVVWAMGRKDLLASALALLALLAWQRQEDRRDGGHHWVGLALLSYGAACLAKPSMIVLPGVLMASSWYRKGRLDSHDWSHQIPFILIGLLVYMLNHLVPQAVLPGAPSFLFRLLTVPVAVAEWWLRLLLVQAPVPIYAWPPETALGRMGIAAGILLVVSAGGLVWLCWRPRPGGWLGLGVLGILALPAVSITLGYREFVTADRYGYLAMLGLAWWLAVAVRALRTPSLALAAPAASSPPLTQAVAAAAAPTPMPTPRVPQWRSACLGVLVLFLVACAWQTRRQLPVWQDSETLWRRVLASYPDCLLARHNLALTLAEKGQLDEAATLLQLVVRDNPRHGQAMGNLGRVLLDLDRLPEALRYLSQSVELAPSAKAWKSLGDVYLRQNQLRRAIEAYLEAVRLMPSLGDAWNALGIAYRTAGMPQEAEQAWRQGIAQGVTGAAIYFNLGLLYEQVGELGEARTAYTEAIRRDPRAPEAHYNLGNIYLRQGFAVEARQAFATVLSLRPADRQARVNLAIAQIQLRQWAEAEANLRAALASGAEFANVYYYLGQIHQQRGELAAAAVAWRRALELQPEFTPARQALERLPPTP